MTDFYGIRPCSHPDFVGWNGGLARWDDLPEQEQSRFHAGVEQLRALYGALGEEAFGRVLRFVAAEEVGAPISPEPWIDPGLVLDPR
jgi:hypothetical protein